MCDLTCCLAQDCISMAVGPVQAAKRAFVRVLLALAVVYNVELLITRDSSDTDVVKAYKKVSLKAHPDKGGKVEDQQEAVVMAVELETQMALPRGRFLAVLILPLCCS